MIAGLKPYPRYQDTGHDWLGSVPAHWSLLRAKRLFREVDERSKTGKDATKLDWVRTWQNWLLSDQKRARPAGRPRASPSTVRHIDDLTPEQRAARNPFTNAVRASQVSGGAT